MKKEEKTERTKQRILEAALKEFGTAGYGTATVNQICQNHNIAKGLVYHNYQNKDDLYLCCARYAVSAFITFIGKRPIGTDLQKYMLLRYRFSEENPLLSHILFEVLLYPPVSLQNGLREVKSTFDAFNLDLYQQAIHSLKLRNGVTTEDAVQYYNLLQNMLNAYFDQKNRREGEFQDAVRRHEEQLEKILNFMLYGIAEKPEDSSMGSD